MEGPRQWRRYDVGVLEPRLIAPRYCSRPFPAYRYVPGRFPHPTAHAAGHSYVAPGEPHHRAEFFPPERWRESDDYLYGCDLYNHGYWWEAHEAWEGLWQLTDKGGVQGRFLQALIQVAACHLKLFEGKGAGVRSLLESSEGHMGFVLGQPGMERVFMGLDFAGWRESVRAYYAGRGDDFGLGHDAGTYPFVRLAI